MNKKYENAKKQGLNWQALLIEETQSELKVIIRNSVLNEDSMRETDKKVMAKINECVSELESEALKQVTENALKRFASRIYVNLSRLFMGVDKQQLLLLLAMTRGQVDKATIRAVEKTFKIPASAYERATPLDIYAKDYMKIVREQLDRIAGIEAKEDYSSRVNLRNIAEMQVRAEAHEKELEDLVDKGVDLVWIVPHANCSDRCERWQGKLYSIKGESGMIDGNYYQPLSNATDNYETTRAGKVYKNGCISGFNCRHKLQPYRKGNKPIEIPAMVVEKEREINTKQRYLERGVRLWKERALMYEDIDRNAYQYCKEKANEWNERYISYSEKNKVAYYPSRTEII